jgi:hypothetical protein
MAYDRLKHSNNIKVIASKISEAAILVFTIAEIYEVALRWCQMA